MGEARELRVLRVMRMVGSLRVIGLALGLGVMAFAMWFFFQTGDPMILIFGLVAVATLATIGFASRIVSRTRGSDIRLKCGACSALNMESAKFCSQCGRSL